MQPKAGEIQSNSAGLTGLNMMKEGVLMLLLEEGCLTFGLKSRVNARGHRS